MSTRYEGVGAAYASPGMMVPLEEIGDDYIKPGQYALTISYDEVFYIEGTVEELHAFMVRLDAQLQRIEAHSKRPISFDDVIADGEYQFRCPRCDEGWLPEDGNTLARLNSEVLKHLTMHNQAAKING